MQAKSDAELVFEYAEDGSEEAFNELVRRHTNLVYSAALRQSGSAQNAADVAQSVFVALARSAVALSTTLDRQGSVAGWLCRTTRNVALNLAREEFRRRSREVHAMEQIEINCEALPEWEALRPVLDEAVSELSEADQEAVVLRFFKNHDLGSVGRALGVSSDAAQKRVTRALEKLRARLTRRGITTSAASLSLALSVGAVQSAPVGLAASISQAALIGTVLNTSLIGGAMKVTTMTMIQKSLAVAAIAAVIGTTVYERVQVSRLREQNRALVAQRDEIASERDSAVSQVAARATRESAKNPVTQLKPVQAKSGEPADAGMQPTEDERAALAELGRRWREGEYILRSENPFAARMEREGRKKILEQTLPGILNARQDFLANLNVAPETIAKLTNHVAKIAQASSEAGPALDQISSAKIAYEAKARQLPTPSSSTSLRSSK